MPKRLHIPVYIAFVWKIARYADVTMAVKAVNVIAALFVGFILQFSPEVFAQGLNEAVVLNNRAVKLLNAGRYSEAEPLLKQSLAIREGSWSKSPRCCNCTEQLG